MICILYREGTLKVGDRILSINGVTSAQCSLMDALALLRSSDVKVTLGVEYDVSVMGESNVKCIEWSHLLIA